MSDSPTSELGNTQALTHMMDTMRKGQLEVAQQGRPLEIGKRLGEGGTKTVYEAAIGDGHFALGFPNTVDGVERMTQKWKVALQEPANTARVREMGLFANPICEALPVDINGVPFTVIKMARYQDLPYQIMDGKDSRASTVKTEVLPTELDRNSFESYFESVIPDVQTLLTNGVRVGVDSLNVCLVDGKPRIFLSDLGSADFEEISDEVRPRVAERYVGNAFSAFLNGLTEAEYQKHKPFFDGEHFKFDNPNNVTHEISERVLHGLNT